MGSKRIVSWFIIIGALSLLAACVNLVDVGPVQTESRTVERGGAERVSARLNMGAGELTIDSQESSEVLEAEFTYNIAAWAPEVEYEVSGDRGNLRVSQPEVDEIGFNEDLRYEWELRLAENLPLDLDVNLGAGRSTLNLSDLDLDDLRVRGGAGDVFLDLAGGEVDEFDLEMGIGQVNVDLSGDWEQELNGRIRGGVGQLSVLLPVDVNVVIDVSGGLGDVNAFGLVQNGNRYEHDAGSNVTMYLDIEGGVGQIELRIAE